MRGFRSRPQQVLPHSPRQLASPPTVRLTTAVKGSGDATVLKTAFVSLEKAEKETTKCCATNNSLLNTMGAINEQMARSGIHAVCNEDRKRS